MTEDELLALNVETERAFRAGAAIGVAVSVAINQEHPDLDPTGATRLAVLCLSDDHEDRLLLQRKVDHWYREIAGGARQGKPIQRCVHELNLSEGRTVASSAKLSSRTLKLWLKPVAALFGMFRKRPKSRCTK